MKIYDVDMNEAAQENIENYESFNEFFTRKLKPETRPIDNEDSAIISPADGRISQLGPITGGTLFQAKGKDFLCKDLLANDENLAKSFHNGHFATIYLSPRDYHRVHMPLSGTLKKIIFVPGKLFSVNNSTAENISNLYAKNERAICTFETNIGLVAVVFVGAMIVASIETRWTGIIKSKEIITLENFLKDMDIQKGNEIGQFKLGSTIILLFQNNSIAWDNELAANQSVRMGQRLGSTN